MVSSQKQRYSEPVAASVSTQTPCWHGACRHGLQVNCSILHITADVLPFPFQQLVVRTGQDGVEDEEEQQQRNMGFARSRHCSTHTLEQFCHTCHPVTVLASLVCWSGSGSVTTDWGLPSLLFVQQWCGDRVMAATITTASPQPPLPQSLQTTPASKPRSAASPLSLSSPSAQEHALGRCRLCTVQGRDTDQLS